MTAIQVSRKGAVTWVTLNQPDDLNSLTADMHLSLETAFDDFAADDTQRICVVTGTGSKAFCAGSNLKSNPKAPYPKNGYAGLAERFDLNKPLIAAVNGFALGGGFELALACDIIMASETATFGLPEPLVGAVALGGGVHRLIRQIGVKPAMGLLLSARRVSAAEGYRLGFVNEVVAPEMLEETVESWCADILRCAPLSVAATKQTAMRGLDEPSLQDAIRNQDS